MPELTTTADRQAHTAPRLDVSTRLAFERTRLAYERTMMAWVRTATSLITFGFTIYKFFQLERRGGAKTPHLIGPREFALAMIGIGLFSLLLATLENRAGLRTLRAQSPDMPRSTAGVVAALVSILGVLALIAVSFRE